MIADLERLNQTWERAWLEKDVALVEKLMADEYVYIAPNGQMLDREAILKIIRSPSYHLDNGTRTEVIIKPVGEDASPPKAEGLEQIAIACTVRINRGLARMRRIGTD